MDDDKFKEIVEESLKSSIKNSDKNQFLEAAEEVGVSNIEFVRQALKIEKKKRKKRIFIAIFLFGITILAGSFAFLYAGGYVMKDKDREILRLAIELKEKYENKKIEEEVLKDSGIESWYLDEAKKIYEKKEKERRKVLKNIGAFIFIALLLVFSFYLQGIATNDKLKVEVVDYGVSTTKGIKTTKKGIDVSGKDTVYFNAILKGLPEGANFTVNIKVFDSEDFAAAKGTCVLEAKDDVSGFSCPFDSNIKVSGTYFVEFVLKPINTGKDIPKLKNDRFGKFPVVITVKK